MTTDLEKIADEEILIDYAVLNSLVSIHNWVDKMALDGTWPYDPDESRNFDERRMEARKKGEETIRRIVERLKDLALTLSYQFERDTRLNLKGKYDGGYITELESSLFGEVINNIRVRYFNEDSSSCIPYQRMFLAVLRELIPKEHQRVTYTTDGKYV